MQSQPEEKRAIMERVWFVLMQDAGIRLVVIGQSDYLHIEVIQFMKTVLFRYIFHC